MANFNEQIQWEIIFHPMEKQKRILYVMPCHCVLHMACENSMRTGKCIFALSNSYGGFYGTDYF